MKIGFWEAGFVIATALVWFGVVLEGTEYWNHIKEKGLWWDRKSLEILGFSLLVAGLAGEWFFSHKAESLQERRTARLTQALLELEMALTPRHFGSDIEGSGQFFESQYCPALAKFTGVKVAVQSTQADGEPKVFANDLVFAFNDMGFSAHPANDEEKVPEGAAMDGLTVFVSGKADSLGLGRTFVSCFQKANNGGGEIAGVGYRPGFVKDPDSVVIVVGPSPIYARAVGIALKVDVWNAKHGFPAPISNAAVPKHNP